MGHVQGISACRAGGSTASAQRRPLLWQGSGAPPSLRERWRGSALAASGRRLARIASGRTMLASTCTGGPGEYISTEARTTRQGGPAQDAARQVGALTVLYSG